MRLSTLIKVSCACIVIGSCLLVVSSRIGFDTLKIGGELDKRLAAGESLAASLDPAAEPIAAAAFEASMLARFPESLPERRPRLDQLEAEFKERPAYWSAQAIEPALKALLLERLKGPAIRFWSALDADLLPAVAVSDPKRADEALRAMASAYSEYNKWIDETLRQVRSRNENLRKYAESAVAASGFWRLWLSAFLLVVAGASCVALLRGVLAPLSKLKAAIGSLAEGDCPGGIPFLLRKDEIGVAARSLEILRRRGNDYASLKNSLQAVQKREIALERAARRQTRELRQAIDGAKKRLRDAGRRPGRSAGFRIVEPTGAVPAASACINERVERISELTAAIKAAVEEQASLAGELARGRACGADPATAALRQAAPAETQRGASAADPGEACAIDMVCQDLSQAMDKFLSAVSAGSPEDTGLTIAIVKDDAVAETLVEEVTPANIRIRPVAGLAVGEPLRVDLGFGPLSVRVAAIEESYIDLALSNQADGIYLVQAREAA